jgi:8-oxo-dGTP pyrophosphatase MutT (NUDIX family)
MSEILPNDFIEDNKIYNHILDNDNGLKMISLSKTYNDSIESEFMSDTSNNENTDLDSSQEFKDEKKLYPTPKTNHNKRCGVIFVSIEQDKSIYKYQPSWRRFIKPKTLIYFLVVEGQYSQIWSLPKGRMLDPQDTVKNESEEICAVREVEEETGIILDPEYVKSLPRIVIGRNVYFVYHTTREKYKNFSIKDTYEVAKVEWKSATELRSMKCNKDLRAILKYPNHVEWYHSSIYNSVSNNCRMSTYKYVYPNFNHY